MCNLDNGDWKVVFYDLKIWKHIDWVGNEVKISSIFILKMNAVL